MLGEAADLAGPFYWYGGSWQEDGSVRVGLVERGIYEQVTLTAGGIEVKRVQEGPAEGKPSCLAAPTIDDLLGRLAGGCGAPYQSPDGAALLIPEPVDPRAADPDPFRPQPLRLADATTGVVVTLPLVSRNFVASDAPVWRHLWSPTGRFALIHGAADSAVYLMNRAGEVRLLADFPQLRRADWALSWCHGDALLAPDVPLGGGRPRPYVEWAGVGRRTDFPEGEWPAQFDESCTYVTWVENRDESWPPTFDRSVTAVARIDTGEVVARWAGALRPDYLYPYLPRVSAFEGAPAALLEHSRGTSLHHPLLPTPPLLEHAYGAEFSPDRAAVAFARVDPPAPLPAGERNGMTALGRARAWTIEVVDVRTGEDKVIARVPASAGPPVLEWNPPGDALLIRFPPPSGI